MKTDALRRGLPFRFGWVDGRCEYELRDKFNIQETQLPNIGLFVPNKQKASNLIGVFNEDDIKSFLDKAYNGKIPAYSMEKPSFARRDCEEFYAELKAAESSGEEEMSDIVKEILEEERRKKEELGLGDTSKKAKKGKKGKKNKKSEDL